MRQKILTFREGWKTDGMIEEKEEKGIGRGRKKKTKSLEKDTQSTIQESFFSCHISWGFSNSKSDAGIGSGNGNGNHPQPPTILPVWSQPPLQAGEVRQPHRATPDPPRPTSASSTSSSPTTPSGSSCCTSPWPPRPPPSWRPPSRRRTSSPPACWSQSCRRRRPTSMESWRELLRKFPFAFRRQLVSRPTTRSLSLSLPA